MMNGLMEPKEDFERTLCILTEGPGVKGMMRENERGGFGNKGENWGYRRDPRGGGPDRPVNEMPGPIEPGQGRKFLST